MPEDVETKPEYFYTKLLDKIDTGEHDQAVEMIMGLPDKQQQLDVLVSLARSLALSCTRGLTLSRDLASGLARTLTLARVLDRALVRDHDHNHVLDLACSLDLARALARGLARALTYDLARDRAHTRDQIYLLVVIAVLDKWVGKM